MNIKKILCKEKAAELMRYKAVEEYLIYTIDRGEKSKRGHLVDVQKIIQELEKQIEFFSKK